MFDLKKLYEPASVDEAIALLAEHPDAHVMAGGSDNLVKLRDGKLGGLEWVSIFAIPELREISLDADGTLRIGALATFTRVARNDLVRRLAPSLAEAVVTIGGPQIRNVGTIGGNICNGVPSADSACAAFAWDARVELCGPDGVRIVPIADFYVSTGKVDLRPAELMTALLIPKAASEGYSGAHFKYAMRGAMDIATVNCSTTIKLAADGTIEDARIAYGVAGPVPIRTPHGEAALKGRVPSDVVVDAAARASLEDTRARDSWRAAKDFREHMLAELARRCLSISIRRARGEGGTHA